MEQSNIQKPQLNLLKDFNLNDGSDSSDNFLQDVIHSIRGNNTASQINSAPIEVPSPPSPNIIQQESSSIEAVRPSPTIQAPVPVQATPSVQVPVRAPIQAPTSVQVQDQDPVPIQQVPIQQVPVQQVPVQQVPVQQVPVQQVPVSMQSQIKQSVPTIPLSQVQQQSQHGHQHHVQRSVHAKNTGNSKRVKFQGLDESNFFNISNYKVPKTTAYLAIVLVLIGVAMWFMLNKGNEKDKDKDKYKIMSQRNRFN